MKNQSELVTKKPPTRIKTQVNLVNKKDTTPPIQHKARFTANHTNNALLKKKSPYSPRNPISGKAYANGRNEALDEVKKELAALKTKAQQLNNDKTEQLTMAKSKSSSQYQLGLHKPCSPVEPQFPKLQTEQLKSRITSYEKQVHDLQGKVIRLQTQVKQKENTKINYDPKNENQKFIQISNLKQQLSAAGYRERSLNDQRNILIQNQYKNEKKIEELQLELIRERDTYQKSYKQAIDSFRKQRQQLERSRLTIEQARIQERRLIDRHTEIIRQKQRQINLLKDTSYEFRQKIQNLQNQLSKHKINPKPYSSDFQKEILREQVRKLTFQLSLKTVNKELSTEYQSMKNHLQRQISTNCRQIQSLLQKNQQLLRQITEQSKQIQQFKTKYSRIEQLKSQQSRRLIELTAKYTKLEQQYFSRAFNNQNNVGKSIQVGNKGKYEDLHQELAVKNNMIEKLHATNKNLQNSLGGAQQMEKKLKQTEGLLNQANNSITKMKLRMLNSMFANVNFDK